jgi:urea transport system permease protein
VIGAGFVSLLSTWFTGGQAPDLNLGLFTVKWVDWWQVLLGVSFVMVTLFAPKDIGGLVDLVTGTRSPDRHGADLGPGTGALREREAEE